GSRRLLLTAVIQPLRNRSAAQPKAAGKSDHPIVLRDGRADHMGKGVTVLRSLQRKLAPDGVGPEHASPLW
ncbi:MAG TPA: hypothetical protein ENH08_01270, partial [Chromatiales bacterium]|nr:hypothetical protein [Chromatiales bacterium]